MKKIMICAALMAAMLATPAQAQDVVKKEKKECCEKKADAQKAEKKACCKEKAEGKMECAKPADKQCDKCKKHAKKAEGVDATTAATAKQADGKKAEKKDCCKQDAEKK